ncbi:Stk1 family PASTA domain-containing Ser/Thr kinase [Brevibacillus ginsengisoli]|uniref:Stk1 family PASTA domain-containing Ser/Thr kinase n=1 Tax=Brevibacillus ginsengisoli TaxID=363854 RepID=UPI003CEA1B0D
MEGQRLGGRYQIEHKVGGGGMAIVYKAKDLVLNRPVAVKILRPQFGIDEDFINRFRREAQAVASLSHPNIVSVYDVGQDEDTYYMVMEYVDGLNLKDVINQEGSLPVEEAVRIAKQVCDALDHAHQNQIIHRDIKPHNILIGSNGRVKVTDFGIARAVTSATITHTGSVLGSVHYFSPEQARGGLTQEKSDIYSLGIVLYEMVTGQLPFSGESPISVALKHLQDPLPHPRDINPDIPQSVENVILRALVKDPFLRYATAREMLKDLETCLSKERLNEPKINFPQDDEETRVIPAITPEMLENSRQDRQGISRTRNGEEQKEEKNPRKLLIKAAGWVGAAALFIVLAIFGFNYAMEIFHVPEYPVPLVQGTKQEIAEAKIKEAKLIPKVETRYDTKVEEGVVIEQNPAPPMRMKENGTVVIVVSKGQQAISMPNYIGNSQSSVQEQLKLQNFKDVKIIEKEDNNIPAGQIIDQVPAPGSDIVPSDTVVQLYVSKGQQMSKMPKVVGETLDRAKLLLLQAGLTYGQVTKQPSYTETRPDIVISTHPYDANMDVPAGTAVPLVVSSGEYPSDAKIGSYPVTVQLAEGETAEIRILVDDARGNRQVALQEVVSQPLTEYKVPLVLSPTKDGTIEIVKSTDAVKNQTIAKYAVKYNSNDLQ